SYGDWSSDVCSSDLNYDKILAVRETFGELDRWGDYDLLFGAAMNNLKIVELPVHYVERVAGQTKMTRRIENALIMLRMCWVALRSEERRVGKEGRAR